MKRHLAIGVPLAGLALLVAVQSGGPSTGGRASDVVKRSPCERPTPPPLRSPAAPPPAGGDRQPAVRKPAPPNRRPDAEMPDLARTIASASVNEAYPRLYEVASEARKSRQEQAALTWIAGDSKLAPTLRGLALWGLAGIGELEASRAALAEGAPAELQRTAVEMLSRHGGREGRDLLVQVAGAPGDSSVRESALRAAFHMDPAASLDLLTRALGGNASPTLELAAVELLGQRADLQGLALLLSYRPGGDAGALRQARAFLAVRAVDPTRVDAALKHLATEPGLSAGARDQIARIRRYAGLSGDDVNSCDHGH